jgi:hypothetical protein
LTRLVRIAWAAPCTLVGLALAGLVLLLGGSGRLVEGSYEAAVCRRRQEAGRALMAMRFRAITFGHVIVGISHEDLHQYRAHERVHVRQYELLGPLFFLAYPLASLWQLVRGRDPYRDNCFEVQARRQSGC